jgi:UTP--glucose-1-phosphate uridylyltransferase
VQVKKAVITAAARGVRLFPAADTVQKGMLPIVDRDGLSKPVLQIIAEEALDSGVEEVCIVCAPGDEEQYLRRLDLLRTNLSETYKGADWAQEQVDRLTRLTRSLRFVVQDEPIGYGHAVHCARSFVGDEPFLLLLGDHLYISEIEGQRCAAQVLRLAEEADCAVAAVHPTREHLIGRYGTLSGKRVPEHPGVYQIEKILEKPSLSLAELELQMPGMRVGHYLCFFGMHVLPPTIFELLERGIAEYQTSGEEVQLTPALQELAQVEKYVALEVKGARYDTGRKYGILRAQIALAMAGEDRESVLTTLVDAMAEAAQRNPRCADE